MNTDMLLCKTKTLTGVEVEGFVFNVSNDSSTYIIQKFEDVRPDYYDDKKDNVVGCVEIDPSTIRRVTPAVDKHNKRIFEGDKVRLNCDYPDLENEELVINWDIDSMTWCAGAYCLCSFEPDDLELIKEKP